jgi:hypothetical protein
VKGEGVSVRLAEIRGVVEALKRAAAQAGGDGPSLPRRDGRHEPRHGAHRPEFDEFR